MPIEAEYLMSGQTFGLRLKTSLTSRNYVILLSALENHVFTQFGPVRPASQNTRKGVVTKVDDVYKKEKCPTYTR